MDDCGRIPCRVLPFFEKGELSNSKLSNSKGTLQTAWFKGEGLFGKTPS
jgi:hypothetical protein